MTMFLIGVALIAMMLLGAPLFAVIAASVMINFAREGVDLTVVIIEVYRLAEMPVLLAIPLFTFAGYLLAESNAPKRLVRITNVFFGWMPGGLAAVALVICAMFTAFTGASGVTIVALGGMLYPALKQAGYSERYSLGLVTTSGSIGLLFAPSLPLILYGVVAQQLNIGVPVSISDLFLAGILPGLLIIVMLSIYGLWQNRGPQAGHQPFSWREALASVREAMWELPLPFIVLGGIYSGYFAVSEAAAVTAIYVFIVEVLIHREITFTNLPKIMRESMVLVGAILIVLSMSLASTNYLLDAEIPVQTFQLHPQPCGQRIQFPAAAERIPAHAGHDAGYLFRAGDHGAVDPAHCSWLWHQSRAPRNHLPGQHGNRLPDAADGHEPVHRHVPLRPADAGNIPRRAALRRDPADRCVDHHLLAGPVSGADQELRFPVRS